MDIEYDISGGQRTGYLALPTAQNAPGVLVLHGGGGIGPHARQRADILAAIGYVAFVPDLFGHPVDGIEAAKALTAELTENWEDLRSRCNAGLDVLRAQPRVDPDRIAAIGFCFGGQAALELRR